MLVLGGRNEGVGKGGLMFWELSLLQRTRSGLGGFSKTWGFVVMTPRKGQNRPQLLQLGGVTYWGRVLSALVFHG